MFSDQYHKYNRSEPKLSRRTFLTGLGVAAGLYLDKKFLKGAIVNGAENTVVRTVDGAAGIVTSLFTDQKGESSNKTDDNVSNEEETKQGTHLLPIIENSKAKLAGGSLNNLIQLSNATGSYQDRNKELENSLYTALEYVVDRTGVAPAYPFEVNFLWDGTRHGLTIYDPRRISVWIGPDDLDDFTRPVRIAAHEFVHMISDDAVNTVNVEFALAEGFATWGALEYWIGSEDIKGFINNRYKENLIWPMFGSDIRKTLKESDYSYQNQIYYQWAGWCDFLITEFGRKKFREVYNSTTELDPGEANYLEVYGDDITTLADQWREEWLNS